MQETSGNGLWCVSVFHKLGTDSAGYIKTQVMWLLKWFATCNSWWFAWIFLSCDTFGLSHKVLLKFQDMEDRNICLSSIPSKNSSLLRHQARWLHRNAFTKFVFGQWHFFGASQYLCKENEVTLSVGWGPCGLTWPWVSVWLGVVFFEVRQWAGDFLGFAYSLEFSKIAKQLGFDWKP